MKKLLAFMLVLVMSFGLVACGSGADKKENATTTAAAKEEKTEAAKEEKTEAAKEEKTEAAKEEKTEAPKEDKTEAETEKKAEDKKEEAAPADELNIGVFYYDFADAYIATVRAEMDKMLDKMGVTYKNYDAAGSQPTQTDSIKSAIAAGANLLIVNVVETSSEDAAKEIASAAKEAEIPVIFFNREVTNDVVNGYEKAAFVGTDAPEAGHLQGEMIGDYLVANFKDVDLNGDGKISYVMFKGQEGNAEAEARTQFAVEDADKILKDNKLEALAYYDENADSKFLVDKDGKWSAAAANDYMSTILGSYSEDQKNMVELVIANNDEMALGALSALQNAGYNKEDGKYIPIFGVDATETAQGKIKAGEMVGSVKQDNVGMAATITQLVQNIKDGKDLMAGTEDLNVDKDVDKIRVPYQKWTAESK
ncbi:MAG: galactose ABC transporter substrate-binding protein [Eubacteriales bacterium]|nr:galactose ABC transporter substrate-binding protein [Clostridiales bacterium]MDY5836554.1 galactose ABC transporter substrate-binding protein [Eubacteriales bacterium]